MTATGFVLGDHRFLHPSQGGTASRSKQARRQILGAPPPSYLEGIAREAGKASPAAKALHKGKFCGHGEPTMTIFDIVMDGRDVLEIAFGMEEEDGEERNPSLIVARAPGKPWFVLFDRKWEDAQSTLENVPKRTLTASEAADLDPDTRQGRVSIGFEYPCDAGSRDEVSWLTIDALLEGERKPMCIVDAELA